uniref:Uncharacterized protein n=1 Tax=Cucumis melo TaxID=3656 RepID=A0A9I9EKK3_CUCME
MKKPELPYWVSELKPYDGPRCYVILGNHGCCLTQSELFQFIEYLEVITHHLNELMHSFGFIDWFDRLHTYMRYICHKSWLGDWFMHGYAIFIVFYKFPLTFTSNMYHIKHNRRSPLSLLFRLFYMLFINSSNN